MTDADALVLIVDDDPDMRDVLDTALSSFGYRTFVAEDGDVAWELYEQHKPNLVISDIYMPRFDGVRLMRRIKEESRDCSVILITGYSHMDADDAENEVSPDALLRKPFSLSDLFNTIRKVEKKG